MSSASKAKGSQAERDVVKYLKEWFPYVDRRLAGATLDKGDISGIPGDRRASCRERVSSPV